MFKDKKVIIAGLAMVIVLSVAFSVREYTTINKRIDLITSYYNTITSYKNKINDILTKNHKPLSAKDVGLIDTWMTFKYINLIYKLPADYLKASLAISDARYPNMSLNSYIRNQKLEKTAFLDTVKENISDYLISKK